MRAVTVSQIDTEIDGATELLLFNAIHGLESLCDSLLRCRVEIAGGSNSSSALKPPWRVKLLLSTGEHDVFVEGQDDSSEAGTPAKAILTAIHEAKLALLRLKNTQKCTACCDQLSGASFGNPLAN